MMIKTCAKVCFWPVTVVHWLEEPIDDSRASWPAALHWDWLGAVMERYADALIERKYRGIVHLPHVPAKRDHGRAA